MLIPIRTRYRVLTPVIELTVGILDAYLLKWILEVVRYHYTVRVFTLLREFDCLSVSLVVDVRLCSLIEETERFRLVRGTMRVPQYSGL